MSEMRSVCVYCGSSNTTKPEYLDLASRFGATLASLNIRLVYGGGAASTFLVKPYRYNFFAEDRIDLGDVIVVGGLRYDYFWSKARRWNGFPRISTAPGFTADSLDNFLVTVP